MAKIMVIAGGEWQCPIVRKAKELGHFVICTNLYGNSPAFELADSCEVADVLDKEKNLQIAEKYKPDAVLTDQSDIAVPTVAYIADKLGLKGIGQEKASLFTNKYKMREFCKYNDFPYPRYHLCFSLEEALQFFREFGKSILKPIDSQSSRGIYIINDEEDLQSSFEKSLKYSNTDKAVLIEQYVEGREFTVDGIKTESGYWVTAISQKNHFSHNPNIAKELLFAHYDSKYNYDELRKLNKRMVVQMGLPFGLTHAEYKYLDGKYYLIEIAARGGGTRISSDIVPIMSGIDSNQIYIDTLLGKNCGIVPAYEKDKYAILGFFDFNPGKVKKIKGISEVENWTGVKAISLNFKEGDEIGLANDDRSRAGYYILYANSYEKLLNLENNIKCAVQIEYERK